MRPQQNRRMRGRGGSNNTNNNNRKSPNPLTRSYESNGPDVKIRGTAQQVAEKYTTLARDAQSSGDRVMAENYLQHAEHYNRLIAAAMLLQNQNQQQPRSRDDDDEDRDDQDDNQGSRDDQPRGDQTRNEQPRNERGDRHERSDNGRGSGPQPVIDGTPAEVALEQGEVAPPKPRRARNSPEAKTNGSTEAEQKPVETTEGGEGDAAPRRARRPRRPRAKAGEGEGEGNASDSELAEAANS
ncbi:DUF4167 domain-containing protein [Chelativorans sp. ZYF759]|uniref:DUF4167 domain-containing protein n=1 Tax=Chelativorans sp. ZYF759 TaxID=2692213 RepID=UPI00145C816B|nr:DUF4167 domain-containing protein [Chelativorans sp. ZYF759]NMG41148.1 DUF4167 domain-containing protein [Chelativorans sp. ZYF759]